VRNPDKKTFKAMPSEYCTIPTLSRNHFKHERGRLAYQSQQLQGTLRKKNSRLLEVCWSAAGERFL
jgi:hypothetical protein